MTPEQVSAIVATGESATPEFRSTTGTRREAGATVCAMLAQRGGYVLFGVAPDGGIAGQQVSEPTLEEASAETQRIDPPTFPELERVLISRNVEAIAIRVNRGFSPLYRYRGVFYRRVGRHDAGHAG